MKDVYKDQRFLLMSSKMIPILLLVFIGTLEVNHHINHGDSFLDHDKPLL